jgi:hypothetical protein
MQQDLTTYQVNDGLPDRQKAVAGGGKVTNNAKRVRGFVVGVSCCPFSILVFFVRK